MHRIIHVCFCSLACLSWNKHFKSNENVEWPSVAGMGKGHNASVYSSSFSVTLPVKVCPSGPHNKCSAFCAGSRRIIKVCMAPNLVLHLKWLPVQRDVWLPLFWLEQYLNLRRLLLARHAFLPAAGCNTPRLCIVQEEFTSYTALLWQFKTNATKDLSWILWL